MTASDTTVDVEVEPAPERPFLRIGYVARAGDGRVIDTTDPDVAADSELADLEASGPVVVVPGEGHLFDPLEEAIRDADPGTTVERTVEPADAFGAVDPDAMATIDEAAVAPERREPGETIELDGRRAAVEAVSDGEVTVDFNHPLAGLTLEYEVEVLAARGPPTTRRGPRGDTRAPGRLGRVRGGPGVRDGALLGVGAERRPGRPQADLRAGRAPPPRSRLGARRRDVRVSRRSRIESR